MENTHPLLSIITPVYNVERYLEKCVSSIIAQTFTDWELILIDDGSKDASGRMCDEIAATDSRIRVIHQQNAGASAARNNGLDHACGDYITFVDSDDYIAVDTYEKNIGYLLSDASIDLVVFPIVRDNIRHEVDVTNGRDKKDMRSIFDVWYRHYPMQSSLCNKILRKSLVGGKRFVSGKVTGEDLAFASQLWDSIRHIHVSSEGAYNYNTTNSNSVTLSFDKKRMQEKLDEMTVFSRYIQVHKELQEYAVPFFVGKTLELYKVFEQHKYQMDKDDVCTLRNNRPSLKHLFHRGTAFSDWVHYALFAMLGPRGYFQMYKTLHS